MQLIADVFGRRLDGASVDPDDDFFQRGGSSFLAALCTAELRKQGIVLAIQDIFVAPTPRSLALRIQPLQKAQ
ncbi:phosphopantetheine-binding protein [Streptomyces sp. NPDC047061]|uniref:phosphopantetheine-binding protein n=1 Tax=Streptomyces sp. NPDC047061 TaxID=3154605 RepID=UPI0034077E0E